MVDVTVNGTCGRGDPRQAVESPTLANPCSVLSFTLPRVPCGPRSSDRAAHRRPDPAPRPDRGHGVVEEGTAVRGGGFH